MLPSLFKRKLAILQFQYVGQARTKLFKLPQIDYVQHRKSVLFQHSTRNN